MERSIFSDLSNVNISRITFRENTTPASSVATVNTIEAPQPKHDPHSLPYLYSALFATILEDIIMEFRVLEECNNILSIMKVYADYSKLLAKKYGITHCPIVDELDTIDRTNSNQEEYKIYKIENDRKSVVDIVINTYWDLALNLSYGFLVETVAAIVQRDKYRADLGLEASQNRSIRRELAKQLRQQRNHMRTVNYDTDVAIDHLRNEIEDATIKSETGCRYVTNWQNSRTEQHNQILKDKEIPPAEKVEYYKQQIDHEQRVHHEVETLIDIVTNEALEKVEHWMTKYDQDMEAADLKVQIMKNRYQNQLDERIELEKTYAKHNELMANWIKFKDDRAKENAYRVKMTQSAIIVQAWWRGLLVRLELGPYKVSKKKGGKKKK